MGGRALAELLGREQEPGNAQLASHFRSNLTKLMLLVTARAFARVCGIPNTTVRSWLFYSGVPQLGDLIQLSQLCPMFGQSSSFLTMIPC